MKIKKQRNNKSSFPRSGVGIHTALEQCNMHSYIGACERKNTGAWERANQCKFYGTDQQGFTLLESLVVIGIVLVLLLLAVPEFHGLIERNKTNRVIDEVTRAIYFARNEAVKQGQIVAFCGSSNGHDCDGQWSEGQIVIANTSHQVLRQLPGMPRNSQLIWRSNLANNNALKFTATGFTSGQNGSFYYCPPNHSEYDLTEFGGIIVVTNSGRLRVDQDQEKLLSQCENSP